MIVTIQTKAKAAIVAIGAIGLGVGAVPVMTMAAEAPAHRAGGVESAKANAPAPGAPILRMARDWVMHPERNPDPKGTMWRYHETWQTDVVRMDASAGSAHSGDLVRIEPFVFQRPPRTIRIPEDRWNL